MRWDLGLQGIGVLLAMSAGFGLFAELVASHGKAGTRWVGLIAGLAVFVIGLVTSEVWFGWATGEDLQPNIDGLSFDEALIFGLLAGTASVLVTRFVTKRRRQMKAQIASGSRSDRLPRAG